MAQIFHRSANTIARVSMFGAVFLIAGVLWAALQMQRSPYFTYAGVARTQPVPFSHQHHVCRAWHRLPLLPYLGRGIRLCGNSADQDLHELPLADVDQRADAGAGAGELPLGRSSLVWTRANALPDFVYFDHSIHINKGVGCNTCHGAVDKMPLMYNQASLQMELCLDCHREPEKQIRPHHIQPRPDDPKSEIDQVFNMTYQPPTSLTAGDVAGRQEIHGSGGAGRIPGGAVPPAQRARHNQLQHLSSLIAGGGDCGLNAIEILTSGTEKPMEKDRKQSGQDVCPGKRGKLELSEAREKLSRRAGRSTGAAWKSWRRRRSSRRCCTASFRGMPRSGRTRLRAATF